MAERKAEMSLRGTPLENLELEKYLKSFSRHKVVLITIIDTWCCDNTNYIKDILPVQKCWGIEGGCEMFFWFWFSIGQHRAIYIL